MVGLGVPGRNHCFPDTYRWKKTPKRRSKNMEISLSFWLLSHFGCEWLHVVLAMVNGKQHGSGAFWNCSEESGTNFSCVSPWYELKRKGAPVVWIHQFRLCTCWSIKDWWKEKDIKSQSNRIVQRFQWGFMHILYCIIPNIKSNITSTFQFEG